MFGWSPIVSAAAGDEHDSGADGDVTSGTEAAGGDAQATRGAAGHDVKRCARRRTLPRSIPVPFSPAEDDEILKTLCTSSV